jgi:hypothetical protein
MNGSWRAHLVCGAVLVAQVGLWLAGHRSDRELFAATRSEDAAERLAALSVLLERGSFGADLDVQALDEELLASADPRESEFACTTAVCKHTGAETQYRRLKEQMDAGTITPHFWRSFVLLRRKIGVVVGGSSGRLKRQELEWWFDALEERALPADQVLAHILENP